MDLLPLLKNAFTSFGNIPDSEWQHLSQRVSRRTLARGEAFVRAGEKGNEVAFVISGSLRKFYLTEDGVESIRDFCQKGDFIGPYSSLLQNNASNVTIEALEPTELLVTSWATYDGLSNRHPCWIEVRQKIAEDLFVKKEEKEAEFLLLTTREQYKKFLKEYRGLVRKIPQHFIASYLGITPVALSRLRRPKRKT